MTDEAPPIVLGERYRDRVSGFVGTCTGRAEYLYETPSALLVADTGPAGDEKTRWVTEGKLEPVDAKRSGFG